MAARAVVEEDGSDIAAERDRARGGLFRRRRGSVVREHAAATATSPMTASAGFSA
jgi:hypothetical protein